MKERLERLGILAATAVLATALACGGGGEEGEQDTGGETADEGGSEVPADSAATVIGTISFDGAAPAAEPVDMSEEASCADAHDTPPVRMNAVVTDGRVGNVYVYVKEGLGDRRFPSATGPVTLDQQGCEYHPRVLAAQAGQTIEIVNSDGILHNINTQPTTNRGFNVSQPVEMTTERSFSEPEVMIPVKCDVHGWMEAYIGVQSHPYAAVTGADGSFRIENLPPGTYTIEAWHETFGTQTQTVTVAAQETGEVTFTYSGAAASAPPMGEPVDLHDHGTGDAHGRTPVREVASRR